GIMVLAWRVNQKDYAIHIVDVKDMTIVQNGIMTRIVIVILAAARHTNGNNKLKIGLSFVWRYTLQCRKKMIQIDFLTFKMNDTKPMQYFFASVVYDRKQYDYYGLHVKEFKGYIQCHASDVFALDHDPSKNEIIIAILGDDDDDIKDVT